MGQGSSRSPHSRKGPQRRPKVKTGSRLPDIPPDSPLGLMLKSWGSWPSQEGKSKEKMVHYCMEVWTKEEIRPDHLYWPIFGSFDDWICQALNLYVNGKEPFNQEESDYAALWKGSSVTISLFPLREQKGKAKKSDKASWEPLDNLPPPYHR